MLKKLFFSVFGFFNILIKNFENRTKEQYKKVFKYIWEDREFDSQSSGMYFKNIFVLKNGELKKIVQILIFVRLNWWRPSYILKDIPNDLKISQ